MWDNTKSTLPSYNYDNQCYYPYHSAQWTSPVVAGRPPPCDDFTLLSLPGNRVVLYGGSNPDTYWSDIMYIGTITKHQLVSIIIVVSMKLIITY